MGVKVGMMKAYNLVSWNFFERVPHKMGFGEKWRWGRSCIAIAHFSILIRGSPKGLIKSSRE